MSINIDLPDSHIQFINDPDVDESHKTLKNIKNNHNGSDKRYDDILNIYNKNFAHLINTSIGIVCLFGYIGYKLFQKKKDNI
jgi:hypothetical protein